MKVLLVDDSAAIRARLVAMLLEVPGVRVIEAASAGEALAAAQREAPDLVILDVHLPDRSGLDVVEPLKAAPSRPIVVVLSGEPTSHHWRVSMARGADLYLDKARDFARVLELVVRRT